MNKNRTAISVTLLFLSSSIFGASRGIVTEEGLDTLTIVYKRLRPFEDGSCTLHYGVTTPRLPHDTLWLPVTNAWRARDWQYKSIGDTLIVKKRLGKLPSA